MAIVRTTGFWLVLAGGMTSFGCDRTDSTLVTIAEGKVERVNECHVNLDQIRYYQDGSPLGDFRFACDVPESIQREKAWWGNQAPPLLNSLGVGDCMRLKKTFYCVESIVQVKGVTLKATFQAIDSDVTLLDRMK